MNFKEFCEDIQRTLPDLDSEYHLINGKHTKEENLMYDRLPKELLNTVHMRLGMVSEIEELMLAIHKNDPVNIGEELTDILWYAGNDLRIQRRKGFISVEFYNSMVNYNFKSGLQATDGGFNTLSDGVDHQLHAIMYNSSKLTDYCKKNLAYGRPEPLDGYTKAITYLLAAVNNLAIHKKIDLEEYMQKVIDKLRKRYPEKFDADKAINRDVDAERKILEGEQKES
jgi:NTP pyrophosphatase (non-canonical NTP hydrolase)